MKKIFSIFALLIMNAVTTANASVLYDAGPVAVDTGKCVSNSCNGSNKWWAIAGFSADTDWNVTGFEFFANDFDNVGSSKYQSTDWQIISSADPFGPALFSGSTIAAVTITVSDTVKKKGSTDYANVASFLLSGLDIDLASGDYYLAQHHNFMANTPSINYSVLSTSDYGSTWYHTDGNYQFTDPRVVAQKIYGAAVSVPEPAMVAILGLGLLGLGYTRKQKRK
jgi:hypothetical protein